ncbi:DUF3080 domain-containing protein [Paraglaciecola aquimarina]|uniref:DUF3080 domain-containing protein n=1 Tax=Paraglaciecola algarum TaxID=3050085 RepID=A0ABS9D575_9ALTE|nr:DUF3080 family protein [Paraglaciecola sp. G1-23]MCF2946841.1 DUF3080 domain-containing protein [Paraglaciecola sp. G1-23]
MIDCKRLLYVYLLITLSGCNSHKPLPDLIANYQARLQNVLKVEHPEVNPTSLPPYPSLIDLAQPINETKIKLFELYQLKHCQLQTLIAQRNTSLGRVQTPSTRYVYERKLLDELSKCIHITEDQSLRQKLQSWHDTKTQNLPYVWADLIQKSTETKYAFSSNQHYISATNQTDISATIFALDYLLNIDSNNPESKNLEFSLQQMQVYALPAKLWLSQKLLAHELEQTTEWLTQITSSLNCTKPNDKTKIEYLSNILQGYFIKDIQPIASQINQAQYKLQTQFNALAAHPFLSESFKNYVHQHNILGFEQYQLAFTQHIKFWQNLYKKCNLQPGSAS